VAPVLTAMTYNIREGGAPDRLDRVRALIAAQRPDLLALQELRGLLRDRALLLRRVADATGMRAFPAGSWFGQPVAVLVRADAVARADPLGGPFHHAAARVTVATDRGPLMVVGAHLDPHAGWRRLVEARWLAVRAHPAPDRLVLLMGDLNTLDPSTAHADRLAPLPPGQRRRYLRRDGSTVDTRAVAALARAGFTDVSPRGGQAHTVPTAHLGGAEFVPSRLDYVLASAPLAALARDCRVVTGPDADRASDHYPVVARFDLDLTGPGAGQGAGAA
jgi:endonuclease/exonuclease/phosphatase family metal-dependent hydrolase